MSYAREDGLAQCDKPECKGRAVYAIGKHSLCWPCHKELYKELKDGNLGQDCLYTEREFDALIEVFMATPPRLIDKGR